MGDTTRAPSSGAGSEAPRLDPQTDWVLRARRRGWWGRGGRLASGRSIAPPTQRQGCAIRGRAAHRPRTWARGAAKCVQLSGASNEPIFAAIGARGAAPRRLQCAIDDECTPTCTFPRFFIQKLCRYWADRAAEGSLASKPMRGNKMRVFSRMCARLPGWFPRTFLAQTRFLEVCATTFSANMAGTLP